MQIPDEIRKCVVFLGHRDRDGVERIRGTGFLLNYDDTRPDAGVGESYLVTAKHNLIKAQNTGATRVLIRANTKAGAVTVIETALTDWICDPADPCLDVAVLPLGPISQDILKLDALVFP